MPQARHSIAGDYTVQFKKLKGESEVQSKQAETALLLFSGLGWQSRMSSFRHVWLSTCLVVCRGIFLLTVILLLEMEQAHRCTQHWFFLRHSWSSTQPYRPLILLYVKRSCSDLQTGYKNSKRGKTQNPQNQTPQKTQPHHKVPR